MALACIDQRAFPAFSCRLKDSFWGDLEGRTELAWKHFLEAESERMRDQFAVFDSYARGPRLVSHRQWLLRRLRAAISRPYLQQIQIVTQRIPAQARPWAIG